MFNFAFLLEGESTEPVSFGEMLASHWPMLLILGVMIVFLIVTSVRSKKKRDAEEKAFQDMKDNLQPGDELTTIGGIIGKVVSVKGETFVLETTKDKTKIRFLKAAIGTIDVKAADLAAQVMEGKDEPAEEATEEETTEENN